MTDILSWLPLALASVDAQSHTEQELLSSSTCVGQVPPTERKVPGGATKPRGCSKEVGGWYAFIRGLLFNETGWPSLRQRGEKALRMWRAKQREKEQKQEKSGCDT